MHDPIGAPSNTHPGPTVICPALQISIYTDKDIYDAGDTMDLGLNVTNLDGEMNVCFAIWVVRPGDEIYLYMHLHCITLPAEFVYVNPFFRRIVLPNLAPGTYTWHAAFLECPTHEIIVEDTAEWTFS